jgi:CDGSH-type Zn-finger protein
MFRRRPAAQRPGAQTTIVPCEDGPLLVRGDFRLQTPAGEPIDPGRGTIALCRCGKSAIKPFCDGTHKKIHFKAGSDREAPAPRG